MCAEDDVGDDGRSGDGGRGVRRRIRSGLCGPLRRIDERNSRSHRRRRNENTGKEGREDGRSQPTISHWQTATMESLPKFHGPLHFDDMLHGAVSTSFTSSISTQAPGATAPSMNSMRLVCSSTLAAASVKVCQVEDSVSVPDAA